MGNIRELVEAYNAKSEGLKHSIENVWDESGHGVAWIKYESVDVYGESYSGHQLMCECEFQFKKVKLTNREGDTEWVDTKYKSRTDCPHWNKVRNDIVEEKREQSREYWSQMDTKEAILDIYSRFKEGEYFGQTSEGLLYAQEVAELLDIETRDIWKYFNELFTEEKLNLNGAILVDYVSRFRFPKEIQHLFKYMVEEPLGWPNGDAGELFLYELEKAIHENTDYKHGRDAFGSENYPYIAPHHLVTYGLTWIYNGVEKYVENPELKYSFKFSATIKYLEEVIEKLKTLEKE